jgi:hypothetical protein
MDVPDGAAVGCALGRFQRRPEPAYVKTSDDQPNVSVDLGYLIADVPSKKVTSGNASDPSEPVGLCFFGASDVCEGEVVAEVAFDECRVVVYGGVFEAFVQLRECFGILGLTSDLNARRWDWVNMRRKRSDENSRDQKEIEVVRTP